MIKLLFKQNINNTILDVNYKTNGNFLLIEVKDNLILYSRESNQCYKVNSSFNTLNIIDYSKTIQQIKNFKEKVGSILIEKTETPKDGQSKRIFTNTTNEINVKGEFETTIIENLKNTAYNSFYNFDKQNQLIDIPLKDNEIISRIYTEITLPNGKQIQEQNLISFEFDTENCSLNDFSNYTVLK
jgi:hypothetical protein